MSVATTAKRRYNLTPEGLAKKQSPEVREKLRAAATAAMNRPEVREKRSTRMKRIHQLAKAMEAMMHAG